MPHGLNWTDILAWLFSMAVGTWFQFRSLPYVGWRLVALRSMMAFAMIVLTASFAHKLNLI
jgi:hypothetical protein